MGSYQKIKSGRAMLATEVIGHGDPVVFLHAGVCDSRMWRAQMEAVGANNRAIAYDRRGFGETRCEKEDFSAVKDALAVINAVADGKPTILVGCSQGGRVALDIALLHPFHIRALVLIAPSVSGAPEPIYPPEIRNLIIRLHQAEEAVDLDRVNAIKAHLWLDGPLQREGRVSGQARELFLAMNGIALRSPSVGANLDVMSVFDRLGEIAVPSLILSGDLDFAHIQQRSRHLAMVVPKCTHHRLTGTAHLPSLERPSDVTELIADFIDRLPRDTI